MDDPKYCIDTQENKEFLRKLGEELLQFGQRFPSPGGSSYYLGDDGTPWKDRNRETWITSRMAHVYSLGTFLGFEGSGVLVDAALRGLLGELSDQENGGWYAGLTKEGRILPSKQCYAHAFVILAASSAMLAKRPGAKDLLERALTLYDEKFWSEADGLSVDTWNTEFTVLEDYRGLNANMHTVEAFLAAADALGEEKYRVRAGRIINHVIEWAGENHWRIPEHFTKDWKADLECNREHPDDPFKPYGATPGHGIEWARLITQWALSTAGKTAEDRKQQGIGEADKEGGDADGFERLGEYREYLDAAKALYDRARTDAWNVDGAPGLVYTTNWEGKPVVHDRMHWTLAEAINTSAVLYRVTGKEAYATDFAEFMRYLDEKVLDHKNGSWFHQMDQNNRVIGTVWPGKSDLYHALQATLIPYADPALSIAFALYRQPCHL